MDIIQLDTTKNYLILHFYIEPANKTLELPIYFDAFRHRLKINSHPSAVGYNPAGADGSNKGFSNPDYLAELQARIDTFPLHNPGIRKEDIPSDLLTANCSGLDPNISVQAAKM